MVSLFDHYSHLIKYNDTGPKKKESTRCSRSCTAVHTKQVHVSADLKVYILRSLDPVYVRLNYVIELCVMRRKMPSSCLLRDWYFRYNDNEFIERLKGKTVNEHWLCVTCNLYSNLQIKHLTFGNIFWVSEENWFPHAMDPNISERFGGR